MRIGIASWLAAVMLLPGSVAAQDVRVGAKSFTESVVLAQMVVLLAEAEGLDAAHRELHGTRLAWSALAGGDIDIYPEYTGTIRQEIFSGEPLPDHAALRARLAELGILMSPSLGFNNTYALGMTAGRAEELGITRVSDLREHESLRFGFSNEFLDRPDGWPGLQRRYRLQPAQVRGLEHGLAYRALAAGDIDVTDVYSTDPNILQYGLRVLEDDLAHFPRYEAVFLYRREFAERHAGVVERLDELAGRINQQQMQKLNQLAELTAASPGEVAAEFLQAELGVHSQVARSNLARRLWHTTWEHLLLVGIALGGSIVVSIPLGIVAAKQRLAGQLIVGFAEVIQTIPGLALLVLIGALFWYVGLPMIGALPVIVALFLYSLLPIIRNTAAGLNNVPPSLRESAIALGLPASARLWRIELPLAAGTILAGVKTTAVITIGYAALGGLIGAGGYGQPIMTGLRLNNVALMMEGAIPAALLALVAKAGFELLERWIVPRGLR